MRSPAQQRLDRAARVAAIEAEERLRAADYALMQANAALDHLRDTAQDGKPTPVHGSYSLGCYEGMATGAKLVLTTRVAASNATRLPLDDVRRFLAALDAADEIEAEADEAGAGAPDPGGPRTRP